MLPSFLRVARPSLATAASKSRCVRNTNGPNVGALLCSVVVVVGKSCWSLVLVLIQCSGRKSRRMIRCVRVVGWRESEWMSGSSSIGGSLPPLIWGRRTTRRVSLVGGLFIEFDSETIRKYRRIDSQPGHGRGRIEDEEVVAAAAAAEGPA